MKIEDILDQEARGAASLKWEAAERLDIKTALEMQKHELEVLCQLAKETGQPDYDDPTQAADWWKP